MLLTCGAVGGTNNRWLCDSLTSDHGHAGALVIVVARVVVRLAYSADPAHRHIETADEQRRATHSILLAISPVGVRFGQGNGRRRRSDLHKQVRPSQSPSHAFKRLSNKYLRTDVPPTVLLSKLAFAIYCSISLSPLM
jgi:hypothetical protein